MINANFPLISDNHPEDGHLCAKRGTVSNQQKKIVRYIQMITLHLILT
jgi:hypothetical protein